MKYKDAVEITSFDPLVKDKKHVPKHYVNKKTGERVKIQYHKGSFRIIE
jgi:hypothetical protein